MPRTVLNSEAFRVNRSGASPPSARGNNSNATAASPRGAPPQQQHIQGSSSPPSGVILPPIGSVSPRSSSKPVAAASAAAAAAAPSSPARQPTKPANNASSPVTSSTRQQNLQNQQQQQSPASPNLKPGGKQQQLQQQAAAAASSPKPNSKNSKAAAAAAAALPTPTPPETPPSAESFIPEIKNLIFSKREFRKAVDILDSVIGSPTYSDLPMFDDQHPDPPQYSNKTLLELLALRIECWMNLLQFGRVLEDVASAMKVDLPSALLQKEFVVPKLRALLELGDISVGLQNAHSLETAVARNGPLLEEVVEWKRKFVLLARKKNENVNSFASAAEGTIFIGSRRIAASAPSCRHGCPDKEPASYFQMEVVMSSLQSDGFASMYRLYTEYAGEKLPWKFMARQQLRSAIDAAATENWKLCRDATRQFLLAREFDKPHGLGERFVDACDTLGKVPNPLHWDNTHNFFEAYDRCMSTVDVLVELLCELSKPFCSCMSEIAELRSRRVKAKQVADAASAATKPGEGSINNGSNGNATQQQQQTTGSQQNQQQHQNAATALPVIPAPSVAAAIRKEKEAIREALNLKEEGNLLFMQRKFHSALKKYEDALQLDPGNTDLFFNRTAALFELEHYDSVVKACDQAMETAVQRNNNDRVLCAKILARRADALYRLGALDDALLCYQESCDAVDSDKVRTKMLDCAVAIQKKKLEAAGLAASPRRGTEAAGKIDLAEDTVNNSGSDNNNNEMLTLAGDTLVRQALGATATISGSAAAAAGSPPPPFASCVLVEPNPRKDNSSHVTLTVFPTQLATASPFFAEALPIPFMQLAGFPFAIVPANIASAGTGTTTTTTTTTKHPGGNIVSTSHHNAHHLTATENFFAMLATRALTIDGPDLPHHHYSSSDIWSTCGSVIVLRKDFKPVSCAHVTRLFEFLLDLWTVTSVDEEKVSNFDTALLMKQKQRGELFNNPRLARERVITALNGGHAHGHNSINNAAAATTTINNNSMASNQSVSIHGITNSSGALTQLSPSALAELLNNSASSGLLNQHRAANNSNNNANSWTGDDELLSFSDDNAGGNLLLAGTHVINTYSRHQKIALHEKEIAQQHATLLKEQGNALYRGRRFRTALLRYDEGLQIDPNNTELHYNRAAALIELNQHEAAIEACERALDTLAGRTAEKRQLVDRIIGRKNLALSKLGREPVVATEGVKSSRLPPRSADDDDNEQEQKHEGGVQRAHTMEGVGEAEE